MKSSKNCQKSKIISDLVESYQHVPHYKISFWFNSTQNYSEPSLTYLKENQFKINLSQSLPISSDHSRMTFHYGSNFQIADPDLSFSLPNTNIDANETYHLN